MDNDIDTLTEHTPARHPNLLVKPQPTVNDSRQVRLAQPNIQNLNELQANIYILELMYIDSLLLVLAPVPSRETN